LDFVTPSPNGLEIRYQSKAGDGTGRLLFWRGITRYEAETTCQFCRLVKSARTFVDIGAHTGVFTLLACAANRHCQVVAFEPVQRNYKALCKNVEINGWSDRCKLEMIAVGDREGTASLHVPLDQFPSSASLKQDGFRGYAGEIVQVRIVSLDKYLGERLQVDFVKIDVEGFEDKVLLGMVHILARHSPDVIIECLPEGPYTETEAILRRFGYVFFHLADGRAVPRCHIRPDLSDKHRNYFCSARKSTLQALQAGDVR
jgi:FkbM family methyltransferase